MADPKKDVPLVTRETYVPDPYELRRAYWILGGLLALTALFVFATVETVLRHGNPFAVFMQK